VVAVLELEPVELVDEEDVEVEEVEEVEVGVVDEAPPPQAVRLAVRQAAAASARVHSLNEKVHKWDVIPQIGGVMLQTWIAE
jgi:hypothetical protein